MQRSPCVLNNRLPHTLIVRSNSGAGGKGGHHLHAHPVQGRNYGDQGLLLGSVLPGYSLLFFHQGPAVRCRAELEARLARMQSKLLRGEEMGGLAAAAEKKQQLLAARQREWQAQKDKAGTAFHHLPRSPCQGEFQCTGAVLWALYSGTASHKSHTGLDLMNLWTQKGELP